ncbi:15698_t:CDS:2 [Dentiscutata erythropus]|uniref:15698_t:CDS:1 n=1 Tax=Dentiscutata erythropus TaxID=1348616 RepID=A0A9N9BFF8_9GLOM|nr:15698_t:CDS:2 [Dentiscutata erythropus]
MYMTLDTSPVSFLLFGCLVVSDSNSNILMPSIYDVNASREI